MRGSFTPPTPPPLPPTPTLTMRSFSPSGTYTSPECETVREFVEHIRAYPLQPEPEIFGLHGNADITCDQGEAYALLGTLLALQPRVASGEPHAPVPGRKQQVVAPEGPGACLTRRPGCWRQARCLGVRLLMHRSPTRRLRQRPGGSHRRPVRRHPAAAAAGLRRGRRVAALPHHLHRVHEHGAHAGVHQVGPAAKCRQCCSE
jgi:hypothetical protein